MTVKKITDIAPQLANCRDYWLGWGAAGRADGDLTYYRSGLAFPSLNGVLRLQSTDNFSQALEEAGGAMAGVPWVWRLGPDSAPDLAGRLIEQGAVRLRAMPVMAVALDRVAAVRGPLDLEIDTVEGDGALAEWVRTVALSFDIGPEWIDQFTAIETGRRDASSIVRLIARIDRQAVGTALMYEARGVAGIQVVTTAEAYRRRGIGAMITAAALEAGRQRGLHVGTLQSTELGVPVYTRMGFEEVGQYQIYEFPVT